jgi:UDP:flavonoid glycosyltransferase YjiC (YdhE family)
VTGADAGAHTSQARRRFVLCSTPALGHAAPLLALSERLIGDGHHVVFFTTEHYRSPVEATGASFVGFAPEDDAHDLMVANPEREASSKRGVRGVKDDLRHIFIGPLPGQSRDLQRILHDFPADCVVVDSMFLGAVRAAARTEPRPPANPARLPGRLRRRRLHVPWRSAARTAGGAGRSAGAGLHRRHALPVLQP